MDARNKSMVMEVIKQMDRQARGIYSPPVNEEKNFQNYLEAVARGFRLPEHVWSLSFGCWRPPPLAVAAAVSGPA